MIHVLSNNADGICGNVPHNVSPPTASCPPAAPIAPEARPTIKNDQDHPFESSRSESARCPMRRQSSFYLTANHEATEIAANPAPQISTSVQNLIGWRCR